VSVSEFTIPRQWQSNKQNPTRWLLSHVKRHWLFVLGVLVGAIGNAILAAAMPLLIGQAFDVVMKAAPSRHALYMLAFWIAVTQIVRGGVLQLLRNGSSETLGQKIERDIRDELYGILLGKSMSFHDSYPTGDLMARATNDVREINLMFNPGINLVIGSAMFMIMPLFSAPMINPQLVIVPAAYLVVYIFVIKAYLRELSPAAKAVRARFGQMNTALAEAIDGVEVVKGSAQEEHEIGRFVRTIVRWRDAFIVQANIEARFIPLLLLGLLEAIGLMHSLLLFRAGQIGVGDVIAFNGLLMLFGFPTFVAQFAYSRVSSGFASANRLLELINNADAAMDENITGYDAPMQGDVVFDHVTFGYQRHSGGDSQTAQSESSALTLQDISFHVRPGQTVAIVGQTGAGKSTITKLINRIYDVNGGRILVDGVDVRDWNLAALRRQISVIEQDIFLFSRSVAENIAFGYPGATRTDIIAAAKAAQAHDFILSFKDGYDTVIGERGVNISGGQRQRLAIARAFLTNPAILILDDATSAIDSETEDKIQQAIEKVAARQTTFLITHRLSQIRWADLIIVMRQGQVVAVGSHEELLARSEPYRAIFARY